MINDFDKSSIEMCEWSCATCGSIQWMPTEFNESLKESHQTFYCTSGHRNVYKTKLPLEEVEEKLANEYVKNAQLESIISTLKIENEKLKKGILNKLEEFFNFRK